MQNGIYRKALSVEQKERLLSYVDEYGDIERVEEDLFLIHSGTTVHSENYLEGLYRALQKGGVEFEIRKIAGLEELGDFDHVVIAAGYGVREFPECQDLSVKFLKGQALRIEGVPEYARSFISKGYMAHLGREDVFELGSTYEREFVDDIAVDLAKGKKTY